MDPIKLAPGSESIHQTIGGDLLTTWITPYRSVVLFAMARDASGPARNGAVFLAATTAAATTSRPFARRRSAAAGDIATLQFH